MTTKFHDRLSSDLTRLLKNPIDYNISIEVGFSSKIQVFKAHSYILQSRSSFFNKSLNRTSFNKYNVKVLKLPDISVKVFEVIIK